MSSTLTPKCSSSLAESRKLLTRGKDAVCRLSLPADEAVDGRQRTLSVPQFIDSDVPVEIAKIAATRECTYVEKSTYANGSAKQNRMTLASRPAATTAMDIVSPESKLSIVGQSAN